MQKEFDKNNIILVKTNGNDSVFDKIDEIEKNPNVEYAEPDYIYKGMVEATSSDTLINSQYAIHNTGQTVNGQAGTADADMDVLEMWDIESATGSNVTIGVIDTGLFVEHTDIDDNLVAGYDYTSTDSDPEDYNGHGSHVAGIIAAESDNSSGISGVSKYDKLKIMPLKASLNIPYYEGVKSLSTSAIMSSIARAETNNVKILNMSFGGESYSSAMYDAIDDYSGLAVVSAGNEACDLDVACSSYPAEYDLANIISISSTDNNDDLSTFSNYGATKADVAAPGTDILSLDVGKKIYEENFDDLSSSFTPSPADSWTLASADGSDYVVIVDPFSPYDNNVNSTLTSSNVVSTGTLSEYVTRANIICEMELSSDSDGYNGDIDAGDTDYLELEIYNGSSWSDAVRFKSLTSTDENILGGFSYGETITPTSDFRFRYRFVTDASNPETYLGCYLDELPVAYATGFLG